MEAEAEAESDGEAVLSGLQEVAAIARMAARTSARRADRYVGDNRRARLDRIVLLLVDAAAILVVSGPVRSASAGRGSGRRPLESRHARPATATCRQRLRRHGRALPGLERPGRGPHP